MKSAPLANGDSSVAVAAYGHHEDTKPITLARANPAKAVVTHDPFHLAMGYAIVCY